MEKPRYPSSVVMCTIPAKVAGVKQIVAISPPTKNGKIKSIYFSSQILWLLMKSIKIGGAHGIAALAYGTETIKKVDKIVGPWRIICFNGQFNSIKRCCNEI